MTAARVIPITQGADRDLVILSALKAAHSFISNPARVEHQGALCRSEYLFTSGEFERMDRLVRDALREMGVEP